MKHRKWFLFVFLVIFLDQITKYWALTHLEAYHPLVLFPMVNFTLAFNTGAAFSFLDSSGHWHQWFFIGFSSLVSLILAIWLWRLVHAPKRVSMGVSLLLGGALGNLCDRILLGHVIDFIDVYYQNYHWPVFNIADSAICIGTLLLLFHFSIESRTTCKNASP